MPSAWTDTEMLVKPQSFYECLHALPSKFLCSIDAETTLYQTVATDTLPIMYSGFHCFGNESRLVDCPVESSQNISNCRYNQLAGVACPNGKH